MPFNPYDKYQMSTLSNCPQCKQLVSSTCNYCPYCGASLKQAAPNYTIDPKNIPLDHDYLDQIKMSLDRPKIFIDPSIVRSTNPLNVPMPEFCSQCGQRINRPYSADSHIANLNSGNGGICFIATACNADSETLGTFYKFRDEILLRSSIGKQAVQLYYRFSQGVAKHIKKSEMLQSSILSVLLKPLAALLRFSVLGSKAEG